MNKNAMYIISNAKTKEANISLKVLAELGFSFDGLVLVSLVCVLYNAHCNLV